MLQPNTKKDFVAISIKDSKTSQGFGERQVCKYNQMGK
jgi:hypothetical protein